MSLFDDASLVLTPNGYKASKLYSIKPTSGLGDMTVVRATTATRVNSAGVIESVAINVPRLDYTGGGCPKILLEPQRTNLVFPSATLTTQTRTVTAVANTLSFYGTGTIVLTGVHTATLTGTGANNRVTLTFTPTAGSLTLTVTGTVTNAQLEVGAYASSYIPTTTGTVSRNADVITRGNLFTNGIVTASGGTWFVDLKNNLVYTRDNSNVNINLDASTGFTNGFLLRNLGTGRLSIQKTISGSATFLYLTTTDLTKIAIKWNGVTADVFANGVKVVSATAFTTTSLQNILTNMQVPVCINLMALFPTPLTDPQCISLTTP